MTIIAIIQARTQSKRFPKKILRKINKNYSVIEFLVKRISISKKINKIVIATSRNKKDLYLANLMKKNNLNVYRGSEKNVLDRFYKVGIKYNAKYIVRITADCPLIDANLLDNMINIFIKKKIDFLSNVNPASFPDGMDIEIMKMSTLKKAWKNAKLKLEKEHVTKYIYNNKDFKQYNLPYKSNYSHVRLTIDYPEDLMVIKNIVNHFSPNIFFSLDKIIDLYKKKPNLFFKNKKFIRNEGLVQNLFNK